MIESLTNRIKSSNTVICFLKDYYKEPADILHSDIVVCFGLNENTIKLLEVCKVDFVVDDGKVGEEISGVPVVSKRHVPAGSVIINCSFSIYPYTVFSISQNLKAKKVISLTQIAAFSHHDIIPNFVNETYNCWKDNSEKLLNLYACLEDKESKSQFLNVSLFRLTGDNCSDYGFSVDFNKQYFEDFISPYAKGVFIDGGGFTGDTAQGYLNFFSNEYSAIYIFEPDQGNCQQAEEKLSDLPEVYIYQAGVSDKNDVLKFCSLNSTFSSFSELGDDDIEVTTIDEKVQDRINYLKLDVEGFDFKAVKGAKNHIVNDTPCMAIAVYHDSNHFWQIPEYVLSKNKNYTLRFRHYSEGWSESVIYFLPKREA